MPIFVTNIELLPEFMQNTPLVTVICLCYNHEEFVEKALNSVINQSYTNIELIIADDCSTDSSKKVIEGWIRNHPGVPFIANENNLGNTKTFNTAFKKAKGDFIIDLAADDILMFDCISKQLEGFEKSKFENLGVIYGNAELISNKGRHLSYYFKIDKNKKRLSPQPVGNIYIGLLNGENNVCSISALVNRKVFEKLNGYDENLAYEDYDFWIRASRIYNFDYIDEILIQKRVLETSLGLQLFKKWNKKTRRFNYSTYLILVKAFHLNKTKEENTAILKRIHYEMTVAFKTRDFLLLLKYVLLEIKVRIRIPIAS